MQMGECPSMQLCPTRKNVYRFPECAAANMAGCHDSDSAALLRPPVICWEITGSASCGSERRLKRALQTRRSSAPMSVRVEGVHTSVIGTGPNTPLVRAPLRSTTNCKHSRRRRSPGVLAAIDGRDGEAVAIIPVRCRSAIFASGAMSRGHYPSGFAARLHHRRAPPITYQTHLEVRKTSLDCGHVTATYSVPLPMLCPIPPRTECLQSRHCSRRASLDR